MVDQEHLVVLVTVSDAIGGEALGRALVEKGLAACVQVVPGGTAIYRWEGRVHVDPQVQLIVKTRRARWTELQEAIRSLHTDEVPEILALPVVDGLPAYLQWMAEVTAGAQTQSPE
jgi:periplasmic divalent cation tolerance protein